MSYPGASKKNHTCTLLTETSRIFLHRSCLQKLKDAFSESLLISDKNPQTRLYFRSMPDIERERKRQKDYGKRVIHPFSSFRLYTELAMILVFFFHLTHTPWDMLSSVIYNEDVEIGTLISVFFLFTVGIIDMTLTFYTGYLDERTMEVVLDKKKIKKLYMKSWFLLFDIIATIPVELIISYARAYNIYYTRWLLFLCITRLFRLPTFMVYVNNAADLWHVNMNVYKIVRYTFYAMLIVSWIGCMTAVVSMFTYLYHPECMHLNWVIQAQIDHNIPMVDLVIIIVYRATSTLIGVKHGKFPNVNPEDKICSSISFFLGFFLMAFLLVLNMQMIMDLSLSEMSNYKFLSQLQHYMGTIRLPFELRKKIVDFYKYRFRNSSLYDNDTMTMLSESLKTEMKMFKYRSVIMNANLSNDLPMNVIQKMLDRVETEYFMTGDCIVKSGEPGVCMYFIVTGTVAIYTRFGAEICHLYDGSFFGEISLVLEERSIATAIALEPCEMCKLVRKDFFECIDRNSELFKSLYEKAKERTKTVAALNELHATEMTRAEITRTGVPSRGSIVPDEESVFSHTHLDIYF